MCAATSVLPALCLATLLAGCSDPADAPTAPQSVTAPVALDRFGTRPARGTCQTRFELTDFEFRPPPNDDELVRANYHDAGTCQVSHLGAARLVNSGSIDFTVGPPHGSGGFTLTAANGDRLQGIEEIDFPPPDDNGGFSFTGVRIITGGTGRFTGARGTLTVTGSGSTNTSTTQQFLNGRLGF